MEVTLIVTLGVLAIVAVTALAPRIGISAPLLLVVVGVGVSFLPFIPDIEIDPEWILGAILPPLLYSSAVNMPTMDFRRDFRTISGLSVTLVIVSSVVIGFIMTALIPGISLATGIALGAIISPTDAVATSIVRKSGVSPRIVTILEGESMLNDASALVILRSAIAATAASVSLWYVAVDFMYAVIVAVLVGVVIGKINLAVRSFLDQTTLNVAISLVVPFVAYLPAEHLGASGLVAAVAAGLVSGHGAPAKLEAADRFNERAVWRTAELILEGCVFLMMGLELSALIDDVHREHENVLTAFTFGAIAIALVIVIRASFMLPSVWMLALRARRNPQVRERLTNLQERISNGEIPGPEPTTESDKRAREKWVRRVRFRLTQRIADIDYLTAEKFGTKEAAVLVWAGMRGAVTVAAAQSLPADTPQRSLLVLIAFNVAAGTLLLQGATLPMLVSKLGLKANRNDASQEWSSLRTELQAASLARLDSPDLRTPRGDPYPAELLAKVRAEHTRTRPDNDGDDSELGDMGELASDLLDAQRRALLEVRGLGTFSSTTLDTALTMLDARQISIELRRTGQQE